MPRKLHLESMALLSQKERKAREFQFHPKMTVIQGGNDVGKSSVIKSIYWTLGAEPTQHPKWVGANVKSLIQFRVDEKKYFALRDGHTVAIFDANKKLLISTQKVTKQLAPFLAKLLNFHLVLSDREGEPKIPPPAYALLPFYLDQDDGWTAPLKSFKNLAQFADFKKPLLEFHTGILPNEYYILEADRKSIQQEKKELQADRRTVVKAIDKMNIQPKFDGLELTVADHGEAIERLLKRLKGLREVRRAHAETLTDVLDQKHSLKQQMTVVRSSIKELEKDAKYTSALPDEVFCPTCGTRHENDFAARYSIVDERESCFEFLASSTAHLRDLAEKARGAEEKLSKVDKTLLEITEILEEKKKGVSIKDVLESKGRMIALKMFEDQLSSYDDLIGEKTSKTDDLLEKLNELKNAERREQIESFYAQSVTAALRRLNVVNYNASDVTKIPAKVSETGSDLPRAVLANFAATLETIHEYSTSLVAPAIVDSPNQQDQDYANVGQMIDVISKLPELDYQVVMGTVSLHGRDLKDASIIKLTEKMSALRTSEYEAVNATLAPYLEAIYNGDASPS